MVFIPEIFEMMKAHKKLWLIPLILTLLFMGFLLATSQSVGVHFIYTLF